MTRLTGDPHWIRGAAAYGCLIGSVVLNKSAISTYDDFLDAGSIEDANSLLDKSTQQDQMSETLAYAAIGIWVLDIIWTLVGTSDLNKQSASMTSRGISIADGTVIISGATSKTQDFGVGQKIEVTIGDLEPVIVNGLPM